MQSVLNKNLCVRLCKIKVLKLLYQQCFAEPDIYIILLIIQFSIKLHKSFKYHTLLKNKFMFFNFC